MVAQVSCDVIIKSLTEKFFVFARSVISHTRTLDGTRLMTFVTDKDYHNDKAVSPLYNVISTFVDP